MHACVCGLCQPVGPPGPNAEQPQNVVSVDVWCVVVINFLGNVQANMQTEKEMQRLSESDKSRCMI